MKPSSLVALGVALRLALAPFFMHTWDMATILTSVDQFLRGLNPYDYVMKVADELYRTTGIPIPYYGYAYLATPLFIYAPFYLLYQLLAGPGEPLIGGHGDIYTGLHLAYPQLFLALLLIKLPVIAGDGLIIGLLARRSYSAAKAYAFSPYAVFITSIWGNFDPLVGLLLLASCLAFERHRTLSGFLYGLSAMKFYTLAAAGAFIMRLYREPRQLAAFSLGFSASMMPSLYFLLLNPSSFLYVLLFQGTRPVQGVNIFSSLVDVRGLSPLLQLTRLISLIFLGALLLVTYLLAKRGVGLFESVTALMLTYVIFAPVTNEQLLASLLPLGLLCRNFRNGLTLFPLLYAGFNSSYQYFAIPLFFSSTSLRAAWDAVNLWWGGWIGLPAPQLRYLFGVGLGLSCLSLLKGTFTGERIRLTLALAGHGGPHHRLRQAGA
jgi:hypothetical protein